ncbi:MAG TPA: iron-sulfur cluster insertion protein ErpA [Rhodanobacteraceae bacterium]
MTTSPAIPVAAMPTFTAAAAAHARQLMAAENNPDLRLRVRVDGGGCSGFQYDISLDATRAADDVVAECDGVPLVVDTLSQPYLAGAQIDYVEAFSGNQFVVHNPNARTTCSCGTSFSV